LENAGNRHTQAKKTELDHFAGRLRENLTTKVVEHTEAAKEKLAKQASKHKV